ncbi:hypothetical protein ACIBI9_59635 [Nonomuraea sp. NPDC050451]|uniref:hypothetical protein n=1 Tax=Nonomuraea sp. NPDC050451 TaxID=3364364 RepID=UPI0037AF5FFB
MSEYATALEHAPLSAETAAARRPRQAQPRLHRAGRLLHPPGPGQGQRQPGRTAQEHARISEVVRLDDILLSARKGKLRLYGKGGKFREIDIDPKLRTELRLWLDERPTWPRADDTEPCSSTPRAHG